MPRPTNGELTDATVTEGGFKLALNALNDWLGLMAGSVDDYVRLARGSNASRTSATEGGWLRWNTDNLVLDIAVASALWHKVVTSIIDTTWALRFEYDQAALALFKSTHAGSIATTRIENNVGDYVEVERTATHTIIRSSDLTQQGHPVRIEIDGVTVFSIDSSGNIICTGNISANGVPI